jgi:putative transcriptional regulator
MVETLSGKDAMKAGYPDSLKGSFLISDANLSDPNFRRTVVLIISHDEEGAFGLVVNRRLDATLEDALPDYGNTGAADIPIYEGGPVERHYLFAIHSGFPAQVRSEHAIDPIAHVTFEPAFPAIADFLRTQWGELSPDVRPPIRLYAGYSGWSAGQLEEELESGAWVVRPATVKHVFSDDPEEGWRLALGELGGLHRVIAETGYKPSMN